jgi:hypothetical protein
VATATCWLEIRRPGLRIIRSCEVGVCGGPDVVVQNGRSGVHLLLAVEELNSYVTRLINKHDRAQVGLSEAKLRQVMPQGFVL